MNDEEIYAVCKRCRDTNICTAFLGEQLELMRQCAEYEDYPLGDTDDGPLPQDSYDGGLSEEP